MTDCKKPSKKLAVMWTVLVVLWWTYVIVEYIRGPKTAGHIGDILWNAIVVLGFTYYLITIWIKVFKASKQSSEKGK